MTRNHVRMIRSAVTAGVVFLLASGAHIAGGAALPDPLILGTLAMTTVLAVTILSRRKLSLPSVLGVLGAGQVLLHHAFSTLTSTAACAPATRAHFGPQQVHCVPAGGMEHVHAFSLFDNPLMFAAHAAAVGATALMLYYGETALELAAQWLRPLLALPRLVVFPPLADLPVFPDAPVRSYLEPLLTVRPLRGPPVGTSL